MHRGDHDNEWSVFVFIVQLAEHVEETTSLRSVVRLYCPLDNCKGSTGNSRHGALQSGLRFFLSSSPGCRIRFGSALAVRFDLVAYGIPLPRRTSAVHPPSA